MKILKIDVMSLCAALMLAGLIAAGCGSDGGTGQTCPTGTPTLCGTTCVNTLTDTSHCGSCNHACATGQVCSSGTCQCPEGTSLCSGACVDTDSDADHCGGCNNECPTGALCTGGECQCPAGASLCGGACVDTDSDADHCGGCNNECPTGALCTGGECQCPTGMVICAGLCVDTDSDADHCGGCNNECATGAQCINGVCSAPCTPVQEVCDGLDNDCDGEIDEGITRNCSNPCGDGTETCSDGVWGLCTAPAPETEVCDDADNDCDGAVDEDVKNRYYRDQDTDSYGDPNNYVEACTQPTGYVTDDTDCDDDNTLARPGNPELCSNTFDDDCDGSVNEGCICTIDQTQYCGEGGDTGDCEWGIQTCLSDGTWGPCVGGTRPTAETCNGTDENCDGQVDNGLPEDAREVNDTCAQARELPRADEGLPAVTISDATLYSTDGTDDTDWYYIFANEATHFECIPPSAWGKIQEDFILNISLTPPSGADHANWSFCVHLAVYEMDECTDFDYNFCTDASDWNGTRYTMALTWDGCCGLDDGWKFFVEVDGAPGEENCRPYSLSYEFYWAGDVSEESCL